MSCYSNVLVLVSCILVFTAVHWVATLNVGSGGAHASYYHRANEQVRLPMPIPHPSKPLVSLCPCRPPQAPLPWDSSHPRRTDASRTRPFRRAPVRTPLVLSDTDPPILARGSQVQVGVEFEANTRLQDTTFSFGYHLTLPQANMVFRGEGC